MAVSLHHAVCHRWPGGRPGRPASRRTCPVHRSPRTETPYRSNPAGHQVLTDIGLLDIGLLDDDTTPATQSWIDRSADQLPTGFAEIVRAWLLVLLDGERRARPRSQTGS